MAQMLRDVRVSLMRANSSALWRPTWGGCGRASQALAVHEPAGEQLPNALRGIQPAPEAQWEAMSAVMALQR